LIKYIGVKLIPHGSHYVYYSLKDEKYQFKIGFFMNISPKNRVIVKKWSHHCQDFITLNEEEENRYNLIFIHIIRYKSAATNYEFDSFLGAYPTDKTSAWNECSNYISKDVLDILNPIDVK
jgi:A1 cistron-splicing factor AAR2